MKVLIVEDDKDLLQVIAQAIESCGGGSVSAGNKPQGGFFIKVRLPIYREGDVNKNGGI